MSSKLFAISRAIPNCAACSARRALLQALEGHCHRPGNAERQRRRHDRHPDDGAAEDVARVRTVEIDSRNAEEEKAPGERGHSEASAARSQPPDNDHHEGSAIDQSAPVQEVQDVVEERIRPEFGIHPSCDRVKRRERKRSRQFEQHGNSLSGVSRPMGSNSRTGRSASKGVVGDAENRNLQYSLCVSRPSLCTLATYGRRA